MKVTALYTYPIKSLRGVSLPSFIPTYQGFQYDRRFMLLKGPELANMHVSKFTEMCLFTTSINFPTTPTSDDGSIIVEYHYPDSEKVKTITVPLLPDVAALKLNEVNVSMHYSDTKGFDMGPRYNTWFSECFGFEVTFVYIGGNRREILGNMPPAKAIASAAEQKSKQQSQQQQGSGWLSSITSLVSNPLAILTNNNADEVPGVDEGIAFADCAPYLIITEESWADASSRLAAAEGGGEAEVMDISKFRPNIVVSGADAAFDEDYWAELEFSTSTPKPLRIVLTQNCARCNSLNVDYRTGRVGTGESGTMLKKLMRDRRVDPGAKWSPIFGRYGFLDRVQPKSDGGREEEQTNDIRVRVGDEVTVSKRNAERSRFEWPNLSTN